MARFEQGSFFILENMNWDAISGIGHNFPHTFKKSYWEELLLNQIENCDGERELVLIMAPDPTTKVVRTKVFRNLSEKSRNLSVAEFNIFLSGIIDDINNAQRAFLVEKNEEKYIPTNENLPHSPAHILSNDQLQSLVGNLPSLDTI